MGDADEFQDEWAGGQPLMIVEVGQYDPWCVLRITVFVVRELLIDNASGITLTIDRCREVRDDVFQSAHVVKMAVGDDIGFYLVSDGCEIRGVVYLIIDARQIDAEVVAAVEYQGTLAVFDDGHVLFADVCEAAEEGDFQLGRCVFDMVASRLSRCTGSGMGTDDTRGIIMGPALGAQGCPAVGTVGCMGGICLAI